MMLWIKKYEHIRTIETIWINLIKSQYGTIYLMFYSHVLNKFTYNHTVFIYISFTTSLITSLCKFYMIVNQLKTQGEGIHT